jgi:hypothetical protein
MKKPLLVFVEYTTLKSVPKKKLTILNYQRIFRLKKKYNHFKSHKKINKDKDKQETYAMLKCLRLS